MTIGLSAATGKQVKCFDLIGREYQTTLLWDWKNINIPLYKTHGSPPSWTDKLEKQNQDNEDSQSYGMFCRRRN